jgi:hypothetical protein
MKDVFAAMLGGKQCTQRLLISESGNVRLENFEDRRDRLDPEDVQSKCRIVLSFLSGVSANMDDTRHFSQK